jgi:hypothetical protein
MEAAAAFLSAAWLRRLPNIPYKIDGGLFDCCWDFYRLYYRLNLLMSRPCQGRVVEAQQERRAAP